MSILRRAAPLLAVLAIAGCGSSASGDATSSGSAGGTTSSSLPKAKPQAVEPTAGQQAITVSGDPPVRDVHAHAPSLPVVKSELQLELVAVHATNAQVHRPAPVRHRLGTHRPGRRRAMPIGAPILAPCTVKILAVIPNWFEGQPLVYFELLTGPDAGKIQYVAEQITDIAPVGILPQRAGDRALRSNRNRHRIRLVDQERGHARTRDDRLRGGSGHSRGPLDARLAEQPRSQRRPELSDAAPSFARLPTGRSLEGDTSEEGRRMATATETVSRPQAREREDRELRRQVGLRGLTLISLGSIIGSGWLLGALGASQAAGPASLLSWILAGTILATLALVHAELGSTYPLSGGTARFPFLSFGALGGFTGALVTWIQAVTIGPIEVEAALGYLQSSFPQLGLEHANGTLTGVGILAAAVCLAAFTLINVLGVRWLAESNSIAMVWKILVPTMTVVVLLIVSFHVHNFTAGGGFAPFGAKGIFAALPLGVVFALQGFEQAIQVGGESRDPQRDIHHAVIVSMVIGTVLYLLLEVAFIGALDPKNLAHGWSEPIPGAGSFGPYATLATSAGVGWLATILYIDAVVSPGGTGLVYTGTSARISYGLGRTGYAPASLGHVSGRGVPLASLVFCFVIGLLVLLPFPSWAGLVTLVTSATVLMYAMAPVSLAALRRSAPINMPQQDRVALATILILARETSARVHLCRLSSAAGVELVRQAKREGMAITCDVAATHVHLSEMDIGFFDANCNLVPPLRGLRDRDALRAGLADGTIDAICSDHTPVDDDAKQVPFGEAEPGATGLELLLPLTLKWARETRTSLPDALRKITGDPSRILGLAAHGLRPGVAADLCIFDPQGWWQVQPGALLSQGKNTPFLGLEMQGRARYTLVDGAVVFESAV